MAAAPYDDDDDDDDVFGLSQGKSQNVAASVAPGLDAAGCSTPPRIPASANISPSKGGLQADAN